MKKTKRSLMKDDLLHAGEFWVHNPEKNVVQCSGVRFGGEYVSQKKYLALRAARLKREMSNAESCWQNEDLYGRKGHR